MAPSRARVALGACAAYLFVFSTLLAALGSAQVLRPLIGQVVRIVDGDTIHVRLGAQVEKVRYIGVNAPELHHPTKGVEPLAREATEANRNLVEGQMVSLELDMQERDKNGRLLAYVYAGGMMINAELVAQGYAQVMTIPPNVKHQHLFLKLQREARVLQLGLWKETGPSPPASKTLDPPRIPEQAQPGKPESRILRCVRACHPRMPGCAR